MYYMYMYSVYSCKLHTMYEVKIKVLANVNQFF